MHEKSSYKMYDVFQQTEAKYNFKKLMSVLLNIKASKRSHCTYIYPGISEHKVPLSLGLPVHFVCCTLISLVFNRSPVWHYSLTMANLQMHLELYSNTCTNHEFKLQIPIC